MEKYTAIYIETVDEFLKYYKAGHDFFDFKNELKLQILDVLKKIDDDRSRLRYAMLSNDSDTYKISSMLVQKGYQPAISLLARCYFNDWGVEKNEEKYYQLLLKGVQLDDIFSKYHLAIAYLRGNYVKKDASKASKMLEELADKERFLAAAVTLVKYCIETDSKDYDYIKHYLLLANEIGGEDAKYALAYCYYNGIGVEQDYEKAFDLYLEIAQHDSTRALNQIGFMYTKGRGVPENDYQAFIYYKRAAELGNAVAQYNVGVSYYNGYGCEQNYRESLYWFKKAAEGGDANALSYIGDHYYYGKGVAVDFNEAAKWYLKAGKTDDPDILNALGDLYYNGQGGFEKDAYKAFSYYGQAADNTSEKAQLSYAKMLENGIGCTADIKEAYKYYRFAARQGNQEAKERVSYLEYNYDLGVQKVMLDGGKLERQLGDQYYLNKTVLSNYDSAFKYFTDAYEKGDYLAAFCLGRCYRYGRGVPFDPQKAIEFFEKDELSMGKYYIGEMYYHGIGVKQDLAKAVEYFKNSKNMPAAHDYLGYCYEHGLGVKKNMDQAFWYYEQAAREKVQPAIERLKENDYLEYKNKTRIRDLKGRLTKFYKTDYSDDDKFEILTELYELGDYSIATDLGMFYYAGRDSRRDDKKAFELFMSGYEHGYLDASIMLAKMYMLGRGVEQDYEVAVSYLKPVVEKGDAVAQYLMYLCYLNGYGVKQNNEKALFFLEASVNQNHGPAMRELAIHYYKGDIVKKDYDIALSYFLNKFVRYGGRQVEFYIGSIYEEKGEYDLAIDAYQHGTNSDDDLCAIALSDMYLEGRGVKRDTKHAYELLKEAVEWNSSYAMFVLAEELYSGENFHQNHTLAEMLYKQAADLGREDAKKALETLTFKKKLLDKKKL